MTPSEQLLLEAGRRYARARAAYDRALKATATGVTDAKIHAACTRAYAELDAAQRDLLAAALQAPVDL